MMETYLKEMTQVSRVMEEEEEIYESMNAELDKQVEQDMQEISSLLNKSPEATPTPAPEVINPKFPKPIPEPKSSSKTIIERIEQQILEADEDVYQSMNAELDKQIAKDMEAIKNYISKTDGKIDLAKRIEFFNTMDSSPIITNANHITDHILLQHTPLGTIKWHECIQCDYKSTDKSNLRDHIAEKHTAVENTDWFTCPRCPYMSKRNSDVQRHLHLGHSDPVEEKFFRCKECYVTYTRQGDLARHMRQVHKEDEKAQCKQCSFVGSNQNSLKQHMLAEHIKLNISWYKCAQCAYRTVRKANLDRHIMCKHTGNSFFFQ